MYNIHRRYSLTVSVEVRVSWDHKKHPQPPQAPGIYHQLGEIFPDTATAAPLLGVSGGLNPHGPHTTQRHAPEIPEEYQSVLQSQSVTVRQLSRLIGRMTATTQAILPTPLHYRNLQQLKNRAYQKSQSFETSLRKPERN